ncbi:MAG: EamA family transporter [Elusimicrobia bacterium]|nr:EamA family transporter [Elusimicrobiota bacterium]
MRLLRFARNDRIIAMWILMGLSAALLHATEGAWCKHLSRRGFSSGIMSLALFLFAVPVYFAALLSSEVPVLGPAFWPAALGSAAINLVSIFLYMKAISVGELGAVFPLIALSPAFMLLTNPILLGDHAGLGGLTGLPLVCLGVYLLGLKPGMPWTEPLKFTDKSHRYALSCALMWSVAANLDKLGTVHSSPAFFLIVRDSITASGILALIFLRRPGELSRLGTLSGIASLALIGQLSAVAGIIQIKAQLLTHAAYPLAIKRLGLVAAGIYGKIFFGEELGFKRVAAWLAILGGLGLMILKP